jgi:transcriptional regulator with PAS, ATPase and Fis domain
METASVVLGKKRPTPPDELLTLLSTYHFPGNIRELESMVFDGISRHQSGKLSMAIFKDHIYQKQPPEEGDSYPGVHGRIASLTFSDQLPSLEQARQLLIDEALRRADGNQSIAALSLGISRQALNKSLTRQRRMKIEE